MTPGNFAKLIARCIPRKLAKCKALLRHLPPLSETDPCADIGTGHGGLSYYYSSQGSWTFIDQDERNLSVAKTILQGNFICEDAMQVLSHMSGFSLITALDVIFYLENHVDFLKFAYHAIKPGGCLILTGIEYQGCPRITRWRDRLGVNEAVGAVTQLDRNLLRKHLSEIGFEVEEDLFCGPMTLFLQTVLDYWSKNAKAKGDRLTQDLSQAKQHAFFKKIFCWILFPFTQMVVNGDALFSQNKGQGFLMKARRKK